MNAICDDDDIRAVSFVGSNTVSIFFFCVTANLVFVVVMNKSLRNFHVVSFLL